MEITGSPNVSIFDFSACLDISLPTPVATLTDISTYISGGEARIIGINFQLIDPFNLSFHDTVYPPNVDIVPGLTSATPVPLPIFNNQVRWGKYKIYATLIDENGTQYIWEDSDGLNYKTIEICKPNTFPYAKGNFGGLNLEVDFDCDGAVILADDLTPYSYKGLVPENTETNVVVTYPADLTGYIAVQEIPFLPFSLPFNITGTYFINATVVQTYNPSTTTCIKAAYIYSNSFNALCNASLCSIRCEYEQLIADVQSCSPKDAEAKRRTLLLVEALLVKANVFRSCGIKIGEIVEEIKRIAGFQGNCDCGTVGVSPSPSGGGFNIIKGNMCGDIDMTLTKVGSNIKIDLSDVTYDISIADEVADWVTLKEVSHVCAKSWILNIDFCAAIEALGCGADSIGSSYRYIGYEENIHTYEYDLLTALSLNGDEVWILIDGTYWLVGQPETDAEVLADVSDIDLGTWTLVGTILTVVGNHIYGQMWDSGLT